MEESQYSSCTQKKRQVIIKELQTDPIAASIWKKNLKEQFTIIFLRT